MKIFISHVPFEKRKIVSDLQNEVKIDFNQPLQLVFTDGSVTIDVFKKLYLRNIDAYFVVKNLEYFLTKMALFRKIPMEIVKSTPVCKTACSDTVSLDHKIPFNAPGRMVQMYAEIGKKLKEKNTQLGIQLSFRPRMFDSIKSSLEDSGLYHSEEMPCHKIYRKLKKEKATIKDLENINEDKEKIYSSLKSLIRSGIVVRKDEYFLLNDLFADPLK